MSESTNDPANESADENVSQETDKLENGDLKAGKKGAGKEEPVSQEKAEPQDNQDILQELTYLGVRLDTGNDGYVWRAFLYENHDDEVLKLVRGLPKIRELWTIGSKVSSGAMATYREDHPECTIHA